MISRKSTTSRKSKVSFYRDRNSHDRFPGLLLGFASQLLEAGEIIPAIRLYRKAKKSVQAAALLSKLAADSLREQRALLVTKKLYVLAALEIEYFRTTALETQMRSLATQRTGTRTGGTSAAKHTKGGVTGTKQRTMHTLNTLMEQDVATGEDRHLDNPWKGAEAIHLYMLSHRQLYRGRYWEALGTAVNLVQFQDILGKLRVYSLLAVVSLYAGAWGQCSKALSHLQSLSEGSTGQGEEATELFSDLQPCTTTCTRDAENDFCKIRKLDGMESGAQYDAIATALFSDTEAKDSVDVPKAAHKTAFVCMATGKSIEQKEVDSEQVTSCERCCRKMYSEDIRWRRSCPLCYGVIS